MNKKLWLSLCAAGAAALFLMSPKANAEVALTGLGIHVGSHHWPAQDFNNTNPGVYLKGTINAVPYVPDGTYVLGTFYNSERKQSVYAGYVYPLVGGFDVVLGAISGYKASPVLPLVAPSYSLRILDSAWTARLTYLPKIEKSGAHVLHLSLEYKF